MDILHAVGPLLLIGMIVLFVINRLKSMHKKGELAKSQSKQKQALIDSVIPLGMIAGAGVGTVVGIIVSEFINAISLGGAIGMLIGYSVYAYCSKRTQLHTN
ncbi:hypothetical protein [Alkalicoccobacillus gibsonii]|uniref:hypothetical protein n=1 Tax=Alkalicoccobacillus gibsonii TaxID=79881 RepID=UPI001931E0AF|nr:hypothetical protein [Alkalicoccobacillus gibsonii]MBM0066857.1 hypothetical protein [Alkalicoccobacillus gibsonii]